MKLSAQEEYGLRCLLQLARGQAGISLTIPEISQVEGITTHNVAKLLRILRQEGFVESVRGQHGGYTLTRIPDQILIRDVLAVLGGRLYEPSFCENFSGSEDNCTHSPAACSVRSLWGRIQRAVDQAVGELTLQDLLLQGSEMHEGHHASSLELLEISSDK